MRGAVGLSLSIILVVSLSRESTLVAANAACQPRPQVQLTNQKDSLGRLSVTIRAGSGVLSRTRVVSTNNAVVQPDGQPGRSGPFDIIPSPGAAQIHMLVFSQHTSQATTVPLVVTDGCGDWSTFVGAGPGVTAWIPTGPTPTPTPIPGGTAACGEPTDQWHPAVYNGCHTGHEHGDPPPAWIAAAGYQVRFAGPFNTSLNENGLAPDTANPARLGKHNAMKGYGFRTTGGVDYYARYHAATNVHDRMARFHSYEVWARDPSGNVSHVIGWTNTGDPVKIGPGTQGAGGRREFCSPEIDIRPEVDVVMSMAAFQLCNANELWYFYPMMPWGPTFSMQITATTITYPGEYSQTSMAFWQRTGAFGVARAGGLTWNPRGDPADPLKSPPLNQTFWATQFGELVSGPSHPRCSGTTTFPANPTATIHPFSQAETHQNVCLAQYIASTLPFINEGGPGKDYSAPGLRLPN